IELDASPPLEAKHYPEAAPAPLSGAISGVGGPLFCQTAAQRVSCYEASEAQARQAATAQVPDLARTVQAKPGTYTRGNANIVAGADCADVALHQIQRHYRGLPYQNGNALTPCIRI